MWQCCITTLFPTLQKILVTKQQPVLCAYDSSVWSGFKGRLICGISWAQLGGSLHTQCRHSMHLAEVQLGSLVLPYTACVVSMWSIKIQ